MQLLVQDRRVLSRIRQRGAGDIDNEHVYEDPAAARCGRRSRVSAIALRCDAAITGTSRGNGPDLGATYSREWRPKAHGRQEAAQTGATRNGDRDG